ncbi:unnamed protein product [Brassica oleracea]
MNHNHAFPASFLCHLYINTQKTSLAEVLSLILLSAQAFIFRSQTHENFSFVHLKSCWDFTYCRKWSVKNLLCLNRLLSFNRLYSF